jgi:hypothetical protein
MIKSLKKFTIISKISKMIFLIKKIIFFNYFEPSGKVIHPSPAKRPFSN